MMMMIIITIKQENDYTWDSYSRCEGTVQN